MGSKHVERAFEEIVRRYLNDADFEETAFKAVVRQICEELKKSAA